MDFNFKNIEKVSEENEEKDEAGYNNNISVKTEEEVLTESSLRVKISSTNEAIKAIEEGFLEKGIEIPESSKELIDSLKKKIVIYTKKFEELYPDLVKVPVDK